MDLALDSIKEMLSSPDASEKIGSMLESFMGGSQTESTGLSADTDDIPLDKIMKIAQAYRGLGKADDPRVNLLKAIKPYMRESRGGSVDRAIKLLSLARLAPLLGDMKDVL